jgi:4-amino-4-deoxy-L-arabinose transferase-like glycosyltransferase
MNQKLESSGALTGVIAAVLAIAAVLRLTGLSRTSLWPDEAFSWHVALQPFDDMYLATVADTHPPLFNLLMWAWVRLAGDTEFALRLPAAIMGALTVYVVYRAGRTAWDQRIGLWAAGLLALSGYHVWYSQEFRPYALLALTATLFMACVLSIMARRERDSRGPWVDVAGSVAALGMLFSHTFGSFLFAGVNAWIAGLWLTDRGRSRAPLGGWLLWQIPAAALFSPWAWIIASRRDASGVEWIPDLGWYQLFSQLAYLFNGPMAAVVLCSLALWWGWSQFERLRGGEAPARGLWRESVLALWLGFPIVCAIVLSWTARPIFVSRYMILCLPAMCLVAALALQQLRSRRRWWRVAAVTLALGMAWALVDVKALRERDDFRAVVERVRGEWQPDDSLIVMPRFARYPVWYYWRDPAPVFATAGSVGRLPEALERKGRAWLIHWRADDKPEDYVVGQAVGSHVVDMAARKHGVRWYRFSIAEPGLESDGAGPILPDPGPARRFDGQGTVVAQ